MNGNLKERAIGNSPPCTYTTWRFDMANHDFLPMHSYVQSTSKKLSQKTGMRTMKEHSSCI